MIIIPHRGLIDGPSSELENKKETIERAIEIYGNSEIDLWVMDGGAFLGHDEPTYSVEWKWLAKHANSLWIHCKNISCLVELNANKNYWHYFWHENDTVTMTSRGFIWAYPGKQPIKNSIAVLPELYDDCTDYSMGVCTDYPKRYKGI